MRSLISSASAMAWIKMGDAATYVTAVFCCFFLALVYQYHLMKYRFTIAPGQMVCGDVCVDCGSAHVDVTRLEPGAAAILGTSAGTPARMLDSQRGLTATQHMQGTQNTSRVVRDLHSESFRTPLLLSDFERNSGSVGDEEGHGVWHAGTSFLGLGRTDSGFRADSASGTQTQVTQDHTETG